MNRSIHPKIYKKVPKEKNDINKFMLFLEDNLLMRFGLSK